MVKVIVSVTVSPGMTPLKLPNRSVSVYSLPGWKSKPLVNPLKVMEGEAASAVDARLMTMSSIRTSENIALHDFFILPPPELPDVGVTPHASVTAFAGVLWMAVARISTESRYSGFSGRVTVQVSRLPGVESRGATGVR